MTDKDRARIELYFIPSGILELKKSRQMTRSLSRDVILGRQLAESSPPDNGIFVIAIFFP